MLIFFNKYTQLQQNPLYRSLEKELRKGFEYLRRV